MDMLEMVGFVWRIMIMMALVQMELIAALQDAER